MGCCFGEVEISEAVHWWTSIWQCVFSRVPGKGSLGFSPAICAIEGKSKFCTFGTFGILDELWCFS
ncbi:hypothetical protein RchiOBHm_Chr7g0206871 [Rosa chinensis]|uniref:Uncharacterized protein n=1 Tax=Rosa chinensis TaxID=74649 RepID=A0A2P6P9B1_ROSCH|nr:hypothetical protein RchiOBHm_Chr7g0206871 [Rosa chinensis]